MFLSFSKTVAKFGGFRLGLGMRLNKKNAGYFAIGALMYYMVMLVWYMMIGCLWLMYAMCYGIYWCIKKIFCGAVKYKNTSFNETDKKEHNDDIVSSISQQQAENDLRIIADCKNLIQSTVNPDTFFMRLNLLVEKAKHLCELDGQVKFAGASPLDAYNEVKENYQEAVKQFLVRYYSDVCKKAQELKTDNGKISRYKKFYESLQEYYQYMDEENIEYIETMYKSHCSGM